eukprot:TRINITY_DN16194_c0_g1_i10.p1 TRINITY_DN16194_c0_g1~~TRINITY_DN16194_c0_g1_i10.p1  ORF type:complete len:490 (-),score=86.71 TRINITY_DN16194_c0_g1_i10:410-1879(-)
MGAVAACPALCSDEDTLEALVAVDAAEARKPDRPGAGDDGSSCDESYTELVVVTQLPTLAQSVEAAKKHGAWKSLPDESSSSHSSGARTPSKGSSCQLDDDQDATAQGALSPFMESECDADLTPADADEKGGHHCTQPDCGQLLMSEEEGHVEAFVARKECAEKAKTKAVSDDSCTALACRLQEELAKLSPLAADEPSDLPRAVCGRYLVGQRLRSGHFATVYIGTNILTKDKVAIKMESCKDLGTSTSSRALPQRTRAASSMRDGREEVYLDDDANDDADENALLPDWPQLPKEAMRYLVDLIGADTMPIGFCQVYAQDVSGSYNIMVMDLLGPSLQSLFELCGRRFSLNTMIRIADQVMRRLDYIHSKNIAHRDIKPENFAVGLDEKKRSVVHLIDFGLSGKFFDVFERRHIPYSKGGRVGGNPCFLSINAHRGVMQTMRDDLERCSRGCRRCTCPKGAPDTANEAAEGACCVPARVGAWSHGRGAD